MKVFISYRIDDLDGYMDLFVGRLQDRFVARFGPENTLIDVSPGVDPDAPETDIARSIGSLVAQADVLLSVIGPQWAKESRWRLAAKDDLVRIEIERALEMGVPVVPVLAGETRMPSVSDLVPGQHAPPKAGGPQPGHALLDLLAIKAHPVGKGREFNAHVDRLIAELETRHTNRIEMVWCPPGTFLMGSPEGEAGRGSNEARHEVTLTQGFWIGKYPVTQAQWESVMGHNPSDFAESGPDAPVDDVSWDDCLEFCRRLSALDGATYRLPTEAEWEYAARAGTAGPLNVDGAEVDEVAWFAENSDGKTHPVGRKKPNAWGIHDMLGNIWEWCQDHWCEDLGTDPVTDPVADPNGAASASKRVDRGGCWNGTAPLVRSAIRSWALKSTRSYYLGFRIARSPARRQPAESNRIPE